MRKCTGAIGVGSVSSVGLNGGASRRPREHVLDGHRTKSPACRVALGPRMGWTCTSRSPSAVRVTNRSCGPTDALRRDIGRTAAPGARLSPDRVVDRDRDVVGMRSWRLACLPADRRARAPPRVRQPGSRAAGLVAMRARPQRPGRPSSRRTRCRTSASTRAAAVASVGPNHQRSRHDAGHTGQSRPPRGRRPAGGAS